MQNNEKYFHSIFLYNYAFFLCVSKQLYVYEKNLRFNFFKRRLLSIKT